MASANPYARGGLTHRGERRKVLVRARMRGNGPPVDVCIRDVSARGMLVQAGTPPPRGTFVELSGGGLPVVGQVVWAKDRRFGVQTRDTLYPANFVEDFGKPDAVHRGPSAATATRNGWRAKPKPGDHAGSQAMANFVQFAAAAAVFIAAAGGIAFVLHDTLAGTVQNVIARL